MFTLFSCYSTDISLFFTFRFFKKTNLFRVTIQFVISRSTKNLSEFVDMLKPKPRERARKRSTGGEDIVG